MQNFRTEERQKKTKKIMTMYVAVIGTIILFVAFHFLELYAKFKDTHNVADILIATPKHILTHPFEIGRAVTSYGGMIAIAVLIGGTLIFAKVQDQKEKKHDDPNTVNGNAHWMTSEEYKAYCKRYTAPYGSEDISSNQNIILSKDIRLGIDGNMTRRNLNVLTIGGSGAGKSRFFASPNILQYNTNFIITDPSGELLSDYGKALQDHGYKIRVFNVSDMYASSRYNPFHYIKSEADIFIFIDTLMTNIKGENKGSDPFWDNAEKLLLYAISLYLWHEVPENEQTLANVFKLINLANVDEKNADAKSPLDKLMDAFEKKDPDNLALEEYRAFKKGAGKTLKSIIISAVATMKDFRLSDLNYLLSTDELELDTFADQKQAMFVIIPTGVSTFNYIVSLMYSQLFMALYSYAEEYAEYGYSIIDGNNEVLRTFQCKEKENSPATKEKAEKWVKNTIKHGFKITYNEKDDLYEIRDKKTDELVSWRGTKDMAEKYMKKLQTMHAEKCGRACPIQVSMILDEFANIGQIPDFDKKLSTIRKYKINTFIILQSLSQIKGLYEKQWNTLIGNCDTKLLLGTDDQETNEYFVKDAGNKTTKTASTSFNQGNQGGGSLSISSGKTELITQDMLKNMKEDECIVMIRGISPYYGKKYELTIHPNYVYAHSRAGLFHVKPPEDFKKPISNIPYRLRQAPPERDLTPYTDGKFGDVHNFKLGKVDEDTKDIENKSREMGGKVPKPAEDPEKPVKDIDKFAQNHGLEGGMSDEELKKKAEDEIREELENIPFADSEKIKFDEGGKSA